jgi:hypothetical protein
MSPPIRSGYHEDGNEPTGREILNEISRLREEIGAIGEHITGNGEPAKGLIMKVDRLEQAHESRKWWMQTAAGAAIASMVTSAWSIFHK